jgi:hypothetical protein
MFETLNSIPNVRRLRSRLMLITALVGLSMMTNHALSASPDVQSVFGMWNLNLDGTNRTCRVTLRNDPAAANYAIGMPAGCRRAMPDLSPTAAWSKDDNGVALKDATGGIVLQFSVRDDGTLMANTADGKSYSLVALDGRKFEPAIAAAPAPSPQNPTDKNATAASAAQVPAPSGKPAVQKPIVAAISPEATQSTSAPKAALAPPLAPVKPPSEVGQAAKPSSGAAAAAAVSTKQPPSSGAGGAVLQSALSNTSQNLPTAPDAATGRQATAAAAGAAAPATPQVQQATPGATTSAPATVKQAGPSPAPVSAPPIRRVDTPSVLPKQPELGLAPTIVPSVPRPEAVATPVTAVATKKIDNVRAAAVTPAPSPSDAVRAVAPGGPAPKTAPAVIAAVQPARSVPPQSVPSPPSGQSIISSDQTGPAQSAVRQVGPPGIRAAPPRPASASSESAPTAQNWTGSIQTPAPRPMQIAAWSELSKVISTPDYSTQSLEVPEVIGPDGETIQAPPTNAGASVPAGAPTPASATAPAGAPMQLIHVVPQNLRPNGPSPGVQAAAVDASANNDLIVAMTSAQVAQVSGRYAVWRGKGTGTGCILNLDGKTKGPLGNFRASLSPACRDQGVALLDPTGWTIEHGKIVLTTRTGSASFDRRADGTWSGDIQGLVLTRD